MLTIDPILAAGLLTGAGTPIIKVEYATNSGSTITSDVLYYKIDNMEAEAIIPALNLSLNYLKFRIIRGLNINATDYTVTSSWFQIDNPKTITDRATTHLKGSAFSNKRISTAGDVTSDEIIEDVFTAAANTILDYTVALPTDFEEWWRDIQFLPTGKVLILNKVEAFDNYLMQKYNAKICNLGQDTDTKNKVTVIGYNYQYDEEFWHHEIDAETLLELNIGLASPSRYYIWRDETESLHTTGSSSFPMRNLGFIPSTASPSPNDGHGSGPSSIKLSMPNLAITPGDNIQITNHDQEQAFTGLNHVSVVEIFNPKQEPAWYQEIKEIQYTSNTDGGALPQTIERVSNYTPLQTNTFDNNLDSTVNNLQALAEAVDELQIAADEEIQDIVGAMVTSNTETGITVTYQDTDGTIDFELVDEYITDLIGTMLTGNTETGISVTYQDSDNTIDFVAEVTQAELDALSGRTVLETNTDAIFQVNAASASLFTATIATLPGGAVLTYTVVTGNEDIINVASSAQIGKIVLHNTTRGTTALISSVNTGTNTITLTATVPAGWQVGDAITPQSQTNTSTIAGGAARFIDIELQSSGALNKPNIIVEFLITDTGGAGSQFTLHPYEANAAAKRITRSTQSTTNIGDQIAFVFTSNRFCLAWAASGAGTATPIIRLVGYIT